MTDKELMISQQELSLVDDLASNELMGLKLDILDEMIRRRDLARLTEMSIVPFEDFALSPIEDDIISNIRLYKVTEMVYQNGESITDKFTTVLNSLQTYQSSVFILIDSDGQKVNFYLGVRSNSDKRSTVTIGDTLKNALIGHFPGVKVLNEDRSSIIKLSRKIANQKNVSSVSVVGQSRKSVEGNKDNFVQGLEKLVLAMTNRQFVGLIMAQNSDSREVQFLRKNFQQAYTDLSPFKRVQTNNISSKSTSRSKSFFEMTPQQKAALIGNSTTAVMTTVAGLVVGTKFGSPSYGVQIGASIGQGIGSLVQSFAPVEQITLGDSESVTTTVENKSVSDMLQLIDEKLKLINEFDSHGMWNVAGYFMSEDMATAEIAASNYRSLMNGENSGRELSSINSWRNGYTGFDDLTLCLSRFTHPYFIYGGEILTTAATTISGKELGFHMSLPRTTVPGLPIIEHAEFGKEVSTYQMIHQKLSNNPKDRVTLGKIFDLGKITDKKVELDNKSLSMHTFITGSTGSGKSNTVYQILNELYQDDIPFLVLEPAKGEYKEIFGNREDVHVFSTNPNIAPLLRINPFQFPSSIHVLEHVDGLIEIFSVCWPMYDAMPVFFKEAILRAYEEVGWDLECSTFEGQNIRYPNFEIVSIQLEKLIQATDYSLEVKGNYTGALLTRVKSLTIGLNKSIFSTEMTPYKKLFDENCILDISRVKSSETKALLMGLIVYMLNEYRMDCKSSSNISLKHVTVLEEAHHLLKNTTQQIGSEIISKSVEMLTNTISEIRTFGEGFIIVDQSPSSVDIAAIKNTNTKIVLRTPEFHDRESIGRSMGLTPEQVNEIAKLPGGVAVVYQNNWLTPVMTMIDKADVIEQPYQNKDIVHIKSLRSARTKLIKAILEPWIKHDRISFEDLDTSIRVLDLSKDVTILLEALIETYHNHNGHLIWKESSISLLKGLVLAILNIKRETFYTWLNSNSAYLLKNKIVSQTINLSESDIDEICYILVER